jgi:hypothetical protein
MPSMARLKGYERPPRGGRGRCQRASVRTPSGAAAAAPPAGALSTPLINVPLNRHPHRAVVDGSKTGQENELPR